jgi:uncharacterized membrane protein
MRCTPGAMAVEQARRHSGSESTTPAATGGRRLTEEELARFLGWFSIALGVAEVATPRSLARLIGVRERRALLRALGAREIATGVGILTQRRPAGWLWARVAGDAIDLALLAAAMRSRNGARSRIVAAAGAVVGVTALDVLCGQRLSQRPRARRGTLAGEHPVRVEKSIIINRPAEELYRFWRDFEHLPRFMRNLEVVRQTGDRRYHWVANGPANTRVEWDAEIVEDVPNERIAWRSLEGADIPNSGSVRFERAPGGRGTKVTVEIGYSPPGGIAGSLVAKLFGIEPGQQVQDDLRRLKMLMETGEIATTEGQPSGRASRRLRAVIRAVGRA